MENNYFNSSGNFTSDNSNNSGERIIVDKNLKYCLGLDLGISSIGWSVVELYSDDKSNLPKTKGLIDAGVRILNTTTDKTGQAYVVDRRVKRSTRRRLRRTKFRILKAKEILTSYNLPTPNSPQDFSQIFFKDTQSKPNSLRLLGLENKLEQMQISQLVLYFMKHRGYKSNAKSDSDIEKKDKETIDPKDQTKDKEELKALGSLKDNTKLLSEKGYRTPGEALTLDEKFYDKKRNGTGTFLALFKREDLSNELRLILQKQCEFYPNLNNEFVNKIIELFEFQRPFMTKELMNKMRGSCTLFPEELRASKYSPEVQLSILWQKMNNLSYTDMGSSEKIFLKLEQKQILEEAIITKAVNNEKAELKYSEIRKLINLEDIYFFSGLPYNKRSKKTNEVDFNANEKDVYLKLDGFSIFSKTLSKSPVNLFESLKNDYELWNKIIDALWLNYDKGSIVNDLKELSIRGEDIEELLNISDRISGTSNLSIKAQKLLLPHLKEGVFYSEAVERIQEHTNSSYLKKHIFLPPVGNNEITNHVVQRTVGQTRKLINSIIREYGSPSTIHIELQRELTKSGKELKIIEKAQNENKSRNEKIIARLEELGVYKDQKSLGILITKYKLWKEQDECCGYSGKKITEREVVLNDDLTQVDHILPRSRSLDDSKSNLILVLTDENQRKMNKTPYEYFGADTERWERMKTLWLRWYGEKNFLKYKKLTTLDYKGKDIKDFISRNLNDTKYMSRFIKNYIEKNLAFKKDDFSIKQRVYTFNGVYTAMVRKHFYFEKKRDDNDRHHALDATIIAISNNSFLRQVQEYWKELENKQDIVNKAKFKFPEPWERFTEDVGVRIFLDNPIEQLTSSGIIEKYKRDDRVKFIRPLLVSRMASRKATGKVHDETVMSVKFIKNKRNEMVEVFVKTIDILNLKKIHFEAFKPKDFDLPNCFYGNDKPVVEVLRKRLEEFKWDTKKAFEKPIYKPCKEGNANRIMKVKIYDDYANSYVYLEGSKGYTSKANIVRTDVFKLNNKYYLVPIYSDQIYKNPLPIKAIVAKKTEEKWIDMSKGEFIFSLYPNDFVRLVKKGELVYEGYYNSVHRRAGGIIIFKQDTRNQQICAGVQNVDHFRKFNVDYLGFLHEVKKEQRHVFSHNSNKQ